MKKLCLISCIALFVCVSVFAETTFRFKKSRDGKGLCIEKYTGDEQYALIEPYYNGLPVKEIGFFAFSQSDVISVWLPDTVEEIQERAFYRCDNLSFVTLPKALRLCGDSAFGYCENLSNIMIYTRTPIKSFSNTAFSHCSSLPMSIQLELIKLGYPGHF